MVALPNNKDAHALASTVRTRWVLEVTGKVNARPEKMVNKDEHNGAVEIGNAFCGGTQYCETPPFDVASDGREIEKSPDYDIVT